MKVFRLLQCFSIIATLVAPLSAARAQDLTGDRVRTALERTDQRITLVQSLVAELNSAQARLEADAVVSLQAQARDTFGQALAASGDARLRLLQQTIDLTLRARSDADRVISRIQGLPDPERVLAQVERTRELLDRAGERIESCDSDRSHSLLRAALDMQTRAELAGRESRYLAALQLTLSARERGLRALRLCNMEENLQDTAERGLHRTDEVLARAHEIVDAPVGRAKDVLRRADRVQAEARTQFKTGRFDAALRMTQSARTLAYRAIRLSSGVR